MHCVIDFSVKHRLFPSDERKSDLTLSVKVVFLSKLWQDKMQCLIYERSYENLTCF